MFPLGFQGKHGLYVTYLRTCTYVQEGLGTVSLNSVWEISLPDCCVEFLRSCVAAHLAQLWPSLAD